MAIYGLTAAGFNTKPLSVIKAEIESDMRATFGQQIDLGAEGPFGQQVGIAADREAAVWELAEAVYNSQYPDTAEDASLDNVVAINGVERLEAAESVVVQQALFGTPATVVPSGTQVSVDGNPDIVFETDEVATLVAGTDAIQRVTFSATPTSGEFKLVYNTEATAAIAWDDNAAAVQAALNALELLAGVTVAGSFAAGFDITFAGVDGKQVQPLLVATDSTLDFVGLVDITIAETVAGVFQGVVQATALLTGPQAAPAQTLTVIDTPVAGLASTRNVEDAAVGRDIETNAELRQRRNELLVTAKGATVNAIRAALLRLNDTGDPVLLTDVTVLENITLLTDARGIPPKAFEVFVQQTADSTSRDDEIFNSILLTKGAGIESHGDESDVLVDSQGFDQTIKFSRPVGVLIYLILDLTVNSLYPSTGDADVEKAVLDWGSPLGAGVDVIVNPSLVAQLDAIPGITDVVVKIGVAPAPTLDNNIIIDNGSVAQVEISQWDSTRITVNS